MVNLVEKRKQDIEKEKERKRKEMIDKALQAANIAYEEEYNKVEETEVEKAVITKGSGWLPTIPKKPKAPDDISLMHRDDYDLLTRMQFKKAEKKKMWTKWNQMIGEEGKKHSKLSYEGFLFYFNIKDETWTKRLFDIINHSLTGKTTFNEFLLFCERYLVVDIQTLEELCFRLMSRRGSTYVPQFSILDLDDIVNFISFRYREFKKLSMKQKRAVDIFTYMDEDGDGGLDITEFHDFCKINSAFPRVSHYVQNHMRRVLFGIGFWVRKSRALKFAHSKGLFSGLALISRANMDSEIYTVKRLNDPVIDSRGQPLRLSSNDKNAKDQEEEETDEVEGSSAKMKKLRALKEASEMFSGDAKKKKEEDEMRAISNLMVATELKIAVDWRSTCDYRGPFSFYSIGFSKYVDDFPDIVRIRAIKKREKALQREKERQAILQMSSKMQDRLLEACHDLVYQRKGLRIAFQRWLVSCEIVTIEQLRDRTRRRSIGGTTPESSPGKEASKKKSTFGGFTGAMGAIGNLAKSAKHKEEERRVKEEEDEKDRNRDREAKEEELQAAVHRRIVSTSLSMQTAIEESCINDYIQSFGQTMRSQSQVGRVAFFNDYRNQLKEFEHRIAQEQSERDSGRLTLPPIYSALSHSQDDDDDDDDDLSR